MRRDLAALAGAEHDLVIVGGGIFGVCAAWDAALRGLSVALVERGDFGGATSANSFKVVHGGIRYVQHADVVRVRESCRERRALLRIAPHLVQPLPIAIPTFGHGKNGKVLLGAGLLAYDLLTLDRNRGVADPDRRIPWGRFLSPSEVLDLFPGLQHRGLTGAAVFSDAQIYNPPRLVLSFLHSATAAGAHAANYVEVVDFLRAGGGRRVAGVVVRDRLSGERFAVRAMAVLNAAGPWAEGLVERHLGLGLKRKGVYSRDACFVVPRRFPAADRCALAIQGRTRDPDAVLSRSARHLFVVPWRRHSLIGVWHVVYDGDPDSVVFGDRDLEAFIDEINWAHPGLDLSPDEVLMRNFGLVPFGDNRAGSTDLSYGKRSIVVDHAREHGLGGLVTLIGIRYTMGRGDAAKAVDLVAKQLDRRAPRPATDRIPVHGGDIANFEALVREIGSRVRFPLPAETARALAHNHGSEYARVLRYAEERPSLAEPVGDGTTVLKAEVVHAVREEMALRLADIVFRRTDLATGQDPGEHALRACARLTADELGWTVERAEREVDEVRRALPAAGRRAGSPAAPSEPAATPALQIPS